MLVGRETERAGIDALLEDARRGRSRVLIFTGEAGIGKSALLDYACERASGMRILSVTAVESESDLPFAGLHALLHPVLDAIDALPERQRRALSAALALEDADEPDRLATSAGTLTLLDDVASERPVLVVLDDAHWLDRESGETIAFVCRRMAGIEVALVAAVRVEEQSQFELGQLPTHPVGPLTSEQSLELLEREHGEAIEAGAARKLAEVAEGNPLALIELPTALSPGQLGGREPLEEPLPVAAGIERAFLHKVDHLSPETRISLLVAAAAPDVPLAAIREASDALGGSFAEVDEPLLHVEHDRVQFTHPLVRSAIYHAADPSLRRDVHQALAAALATEPDLRAWQLAAAAAGPDEKAAVALEQAADRAVSRGGHAARARALERAAELSPHPADRARRMCAAAQAAFWAGDSRRAIAVCERALPLAADPLLRADLVHQLWSVAGWQTDSGGITLDFDAEVARVEDIDADRAAKLLVLLLNQHLGALEYGRAAATASRAEQLVDRMGPWWRPRVILGIAESRLFLGNATAANEAFDEFLATDLVAVAAFFQSLIWLERHDDARRALIASLELGQSDGNVLRVAHAQGGLAMLELSTGNLPRARALASDALQQAEALGVAFLEAFDLVTLATIDALQGRAESCRDRVAAAISRAPHIANDDQRLSARLALGLFESSGARYDAVLVELEPVHARVVASGLAEPSLFPYQPDLVEAYAKLGRVDDAVAVLGWFESQAEAMERRWALAAAARCRGLLVDVDELDATFALALERYDDVPSPFERARTQLAYGERLRRANRRRDARPHLRAALDAFDEIDAVPWSERAHAELRATGERVPPRARDEREQLTPQELQIATLVAQGLTNREIGAQIFLSPKTVEYHLTHVYRKLDIHSRVELIRQFAADRAELEVSSS